MKGAIRHRRTRPLFDSPDASGAVISDCGLFRYLLWRVWDPALPCMVLVMLNPSRADAEADDRTVVKCMGFAARLGYGSIRIVNLFAYRTPKPEILARDGWPVGPDNDDFIAAAIAAGSSTGARVVCAWGSNGGEPAAVRRVTVLRVIMRTLRVEPWCLGRAINLHPLHPLYLKYDRPLERLDLAALGG